MSPELVFLIFAAGMAALAILLLLFGKRFIRFLQSSTEGPAPNPAPVSPQQTWQGTQPEEEADEEPEVLTAVVGKVYPIEGTFPTKMRVDDIDDDNEEVYATLLIELEAGREIKGIQNGEGYFSVVYVEGAIWKTLTWYHEHAQLPEFDNGYECQVEELEVSVAS